MTAEDSHQIVPAIRDWIAATSETDVPVGLSRQEAHRGARRLIGDIAAGIGSQISVVDADLMDVLWAVVEICESMDPGPRALVESDQIYRFIVELPQTVDFFDERSQLLRRIARAGWRSYPEGLEGVLRSRAALFEHGDARWHRELCENADDTRDRIDALGDKDNVDLAAIYEIGGTLLRLASIRPAVVAAAAADLKSHVLDRAERVGWLDDREYLRAIVAYAAGIAARLLSRWDEAESQYSLAVESLRRSTNAFEVERVEVERLAVLTTRMDNEAVTRIAPAQIKRAKLPRERLKAELILAHSFHNLGRNQEAQVILERVRRTPELQKEPALKVFALRMLGSVRSEQGCFRKAMAAFKLAARVLSEYYFPFQLASVTAGLADHFGRVGNRGDAAILLGKARRVFREFGQSSMVVYVSILRAEMLVLLGRSHDAESELLAVLPLVEEFDLRREGIAALALLREAISKQRTDVNMIRGLRAQLFGEKKA